MMGRTELSLGLITWVKSGLEASMSVFPLKYDDNIHKLVGIFKHTYAYIRFLRI